MTKRDWGSVRQLKSGRWQARYLGADGLPRTAPHTFTRRRDAADWLAATRAEIAKDDWIDPDLAKVDLLTYGERWIAERRLADTTRERYEISFQRHIVPQLGRLPLASVREGTIRTWFAGLHNAGVGNASASKAYRLLHAIFATAVDDQVLRRNPCRIKGASLDRSEERKVLSIDEVFRIAGAMPPRFRALVLLAAFTSLRFGELAALQRGDLDLDAREVAVRRAQAELRGGRLLIKDPKSAAGLRDVAIPQTIADELRFHLDHFVDSEPTARLFVGPKGGVLQRHNFRNTWMTAIENAGVSRPDVHFHDLRHTGNDLAAKTGASTRELMARMGHSSIRAALIYQHASRDRDHEIARKIDADLARLQPQPRPATSEIWHIAGTPPKMVGGK